MKKERKGEREELGRWRGNLIDLSRQSRDKENRHLCQSFDGPGKKIVVYKILKLTIFFIRVHYSTDFLFFLLWILGFRTNFKIIGSGTLVFSDHVKTV